MYNRRRWTHKGILTKYSTKIPGGKTGTFGIYFTLNAHSSPTFILKEATIVYEFMIPCH